MTSGLFFDATGRDRITGEDGLTTGFAFKAGKPSFIPTIIRTDRINYTVTLRVNTPSAHTGTTGTRTTESSSQQQNEAFLHRHDSVLRMSRARESHVVDIIPDDVSDVPEAVADVDIDDVVVGEDDVVIGEDDGSVDDIPAFDPKKTAMSRVSRKKDPVGYIEAYKELLDEHIVRLEHMLDTMMRTQQPHQSMLRNSIVQAKALQKSFEFVPECARRRVRVAGSAGASAAANALDRPVRISNELKEFLAIPEGENDVVSRVDVTRALNAYVNFSATETDEKKLRWRHLNPDNTRDLRVRGGERFEIKFDDALKKLLRYDQYAAERAEEGKEPITRYGTIQKLVQIHLTSTTPSAKK